MDFQFRDIDNLSPSDFEIFVRDLFISAGWSDAYITRVGKEFKHGDGGIDIICKKNDKSYAIEVKQRNLETRVDISALNQLMAGAELRKIKNKILVTNSYFTTEVQARALMSGVELFDRERLKSLWFTKSTDLGRQIKVRTYQKKVIDEGLEKFNRNINKQLIEMATGLGKTYTVAMYIKELAKIHPNSEMKVLFIAHQIEILQQSVTAFKNVLGISDYTYSACFGGIDPEDTNFVFATFDTLILKLDKLKNDSYEFIIVDEAHHVPAFTYAQVVNHFNPRLLIGLTATPFRADGRNVTEFFGGEEGHIGRYDLLWALKGKYLAYPKYLVMLDNLNQEKIDQLHRGLNLRDIDKHLFLHKKDEQIVKIIEEKIIEEKIHSPKGIVFCRNIKHMNHLIHFFELGSAVMVHSEMSDLARRENIRAFREGDKKFILACDLFNEGIDIPETNILVFMRSSSSRTIWLQQLGRGLRKTPNKDCVYILDFVGSLDRVYEIKKLVASVQNYKFDKADMSENSDKEYHDNSIDVHYSSEAAKVFDLLEHFKFILNSKSALIDKIVSYYNTFCSIPDLTELEEKLDGVFLEHIYTIFNSYSEYIRTSLPELYHNLISHTDLHEYIKNQVSLYKHVPSARAIQNHFTYQNLPKYSLQEIKKELNNIKLQDEFITSTSLTGVEHKLCPSSDDYTVPDGIINEINNEDENFFKTFSHRIKNRSDFNKMSSDEKSEIISKFKSASIFLKRLKEYQ